MLEETGNRCGVRGASVSSGAALVQLVTAAQLRAGDEFLALPGASATAVLAAMERFVRLGGSGRRVIAATEERPGLVAVKLDRPSPVPLLMAGDVRVLVVVRGEAGR